MWQFSVTKCVVLSQEEKKREKNFHFCFFFISHAFVIYTIFSFVFFFFRTHSAKTQFHHNRECYKMMMLQCSMHYKQQCHNLLSRNAYKWFRIKHERRKRLTNTALPFDMNNSKNSMKNAWHLLHIFGRSSIAFCAIIFQSIKTFITANAYTQYPSIASPCHNFWGFVCQAIRCVKEEYGKMKEKKTVCSY